MQRSPPQPRGASPGEAAKRPVLRPAASSRWVQVLYLFAGAKRRSGLASSLRRAFRGTDMKVNIEEIDVLRGGKRHDLLSKTRQARLLARIEKGEFVLVVSSPPCGTFSRARHANTRGPRPARSRTFPRGFPWLRGKARMHVQEANTLVDFTVAALAAQHLTTPGLTVLEHPEDLGRVKTEDPGSIWQLPCIRTLGAAEGVVTCAIKQSDFGTDFPKPTRLLGRLPGLDKGTATGWPKFDTDGWYVGPLAKHVGTSARLIGRQGAVFATAATAAWPPKLCDYLADLVAHACSEKGDIQEVGAASQVTSKGQSDPEPIVSATTALTNGGCAGLAVAAKSPTRRRITKEEFENLAKGNSIGEDLCYVGRGGRGAPPSKWGNPFRINAQCSRAESVRKYGAFVAETGLHDSIHELSGKDLLCHCRPDELCHADHLLELLKAARDSSMGCFLDDGLPVRIPQGHKEPAPESPPGVKAGWHGSGPPRRSRHMGGDKPFNDGGGLCSPGRWLPGKRRLAAALPGLRASLIGQFENAARRASGGTDDAWPS